MNICCGKIESILTDPQNNVYYNKVFREYYIQTKINEIILTMNFCPWCGKAFPLSLRDPFFEVLELEYGIDTSIGEYKTNPDIPQEFRSDEWWKKRGL